MLFPYNRNKHNKKWMLMFYSIDSLYSMPMDIKHREIEFNPLSSSDEQTVHCAGKFLNELDDILMAQALSEVCLHVAYDINVISLEKIELILNKAGFHLDNSLMSKLKRAIIYYAEETIQNNNQTQTELSPSIDAAIQRYCKRPHGCRDSRPKHWRNYK